MLMPSRISFKRKGVFGLLSIGGLLLVAICLFFLPSDDEPKPSGDMGSMATTADSGSGRSSQDAELLASAELERLLSIENGREREGALADFFARLDPSLFPELRDVFRRIPEEINIDLELGLFVGYWAFHDGRAAIGFVDELYPRFNGLVLPTRDALAVWGRVDPKASSEYVAGISDERSAWKRICIDGVAAPLAQLDARQAMDWAGGAASDYRWIMLDSVAQHLPEASLGQTGDWLLAVAADTDNPMEIYKASRTLIQRDAIVDPLRILDWTHKRLPAGKLRDKAIDASIYEVARRHPEVVAEYLASEDYGSTILSESGENERQKRFDSIVELALAGLNESPEYELALENIDLIKDLHRRAAIVADIDSFEN